MKRAMQIKNVVKPVMGLIVVVRRVVAIAVWVVMEIVSVIGTVVGVRVAGVVLVAGRVAVIRRGSIEGALTVREGMLGKAVGRAVLTDHSKRSNWKDNSKTQSRSYGTNRLHQKQRKENKPMDTHFYPPRLFLIGYSRTSKGSFSSSSPSACVVDVSMLNLSSRSIEVEKVEFLPDIIIQRNQVSSPNVAAHRG